jgi:hypothetical protein
MILSFKSAYVASRVAYYHKAEKYYIILWKNFGEMGIIRLYHVHKKKYITVYCNLSNGPVEANSRLRIQICRVYVPLRDKMELNYITHC